MRVIIVRRIFAVLLAIVFVPLFLVAIVVAQVNSTVLSSKFYVSQLREADLFAWAYDDLAPVAFDQAIADQTDDAALQKSLTKVKPKAIAAAKEALPPEWLEEQAESVVNQVVPYMVGDTDEFTVTVPLKQPIEGLGKGIKSLAADPEVYALVVDEAIAPEIVKQVEQAKLPLGLHIQGDDVVDAAKQVASQEWVAKTTATVVDQVTPYAIGQSDHLAVVIPISDRIEAAEPAVKDLLAKSGAYEVLDTPEFRDAVQKQLSAFGSLPLGLTLTADQLAVAAQEVATPLWLQQQTEAILDAVTPYLAGKQDTFVVVVPLKDRVVVAVPVAKRLLRESGAYQKAMDQVVDTLLKQNLSGPIALPLGSSVTPDEVRPLLRQALPPDFVQQQAEAMIDEMVPYLVGDRTTFRIVVPLQTPKDKALVAIEPLVTQKLRQRWDALPACTVQQAADLLKQSSIAAIPTCRPAGYTLAQLKTALGIPPQTNVTEDDIAKQLGVDRTLLVQGVTFQWLLDRFGSLLTQQVKQFVGGSIPNEFVYTDADLRKTLGAEHERQLDQALGWAHTGYRFTDADLRRLAGAGSDNLKTLDNVRKWAKEGFAYTDADLRNDISQDGKDSAVLATYDDALRWAREGFTFTQADLLDQMQPADRSSFEQARSAAATFRKLRWVVYLIPMLLLAGIAFLGGRSWRGRLAWGAAVLGVAGLLAFVAFGVVYQAVAWPMIEQEIGNAMQTSTALERVLQVKALEVARSLSNGVIGGLARRSFVFLALALLGIAAVIFWRPLTGLLKRQPKAG